MRQSDEVRPEGPATTVAAATTVPLRHATLDPLDSFVACIPCSHAANGAHFDWRSTRCSVQLSAVAAWHLDVLSRRLRRSVRLSISAAHTALLSVSFDCTNIERSPALHSVCCVSAPSLLSHHSPLSWAIAPSSLPLLSHRTAIFVAMNRSGASRASGSGAAAAAKLGDSKLLRTKHIDTLEVLETYSQDMARLQKENKSLAQQLSKFVRPLQRSPQRVCMRAGGTSTRQPVAGTLSRAAGVPLILLRRCCFCCCCCCAQTSVSGDPYSQISSLESILAVERNSNAEMTGRIKILTGEIERHVQKQAHTRTHTHAQAHADSFARPAPAPEPHAPDCSLRLQSTRLPRRCAMFVVPAPCPQRSEQSQRETSLRDALSQASSLRSELSRLGLAHTEVLSARSALEKKLSALTSEAHELRQRLAGMESELTACREAMQRQAERVRQLEIQAAVGAPLPLATATATAAAAAAAAASSEEAQTARSLRAKAAKSKEKLREKEAQLARQLDELAQLRGELAAAAQSEAHKKLVAELAAAQKQVQAANATAAAATAAAAASSSARKQASASAAKEDLARRERAWNTERRDLLAQLEAAKSAAAAAAQAHPSSSRVPTRSEQEHRELVQHLQSEVAALRAQNEHTHAQNQLLRSEHTKLSAAFNKVLAGGGGIGGKASVSTGTAPAPGNTITIASKKGAFPEFVAAKRENEALHQQVSELRHAAHILQNRLAQAMLSQPQQQPQQQMQQQAQAQAQGVQQPRPARASVGALGSSGSSAQLQQQAGSFSSSSGPSTASPGPSRHVVAAPAGVVGSVGAPINKRSSGGWSTAALPASSASGAGRVRR